MHDTLFARSGRPSNRKRNFILEHVISNKWLYIMMLPGLIYFLVFKYLPMWGIMISFKNYQPYLGFAKSSWVGFAHFTRFFSESTFIMIFRNTIVLALYNIFFVFPFPIIIALILNEVKNAIFKRSIQTIIYIPHFMSWVVVVSISYILFTTQGGVINNMIASFGGDRVNFLGNPGLFRIMITGQLMWKETGWDTIIYLAALCSIDPQLYEASYIDGAKRFKRLIYITLPCISSTIITLLILRLGYFLDSGFEQIYLMLNAMNRNVGEVFDTYIYEMGIVQGNFSYSTAIGLFKSLVGLFLIFVSNQFAKRIGEEGIF